MNSRETVDSEVDLANRELEADASKGSGKGLPRRRSTSITTVTTKWYGVGWLQRICRISERRSEQKGDSPSNQRLEVDWKFLP
jgi:hypothetical protein